MDIKVLTCTTDAGKFSVIADEHTRRLFETEAGMYFKRYAVDFPAITAANVDFIVFDRIDVDYHPLQFGELARQIIDLSADKRVWVYTLDDTFLLALRAEIALSAGDESVDVHVIDRDGETHLMRINGAGIFDPHPVFKRTAMSAPMLYSTALLCAQTIEVERVIHAD